MKKGVLFIITLLCLLVLFGACGSSSSLVGVWEEIDGDGILYFAEDNTGLSVNVSYTADSFEYEEKKEKLVFIADTTIETDHTIENKILTITLDSTDYRYKLVELSESEIEGYLSERGFDTTDFNGGKKPTDIPTAPTGDATLGTDDSEEKGSADEEIAESIVGAWRGGDDSVSLVYIFNEDGTGYAAIFPFTYTVKDGVISLEITGFGEVEYGSARYELDGDHIYIENDKGTYVLERTEMPDNLPEIPKK